MATYQVIAPCVVDGKHYTRPHPTPVELSEAEAGPLVEAGRLTPVETEEPAPVPAPVQTPPETAAEATAEHARRPRRHDTE